MADTRRIRQGYVMVAMAVPENVATMLRIQAVVNHQSIGDYVTSLVPETLDALPTKAKASKAKQGPKAVTPPTPKPTRQEYEHTDERMSLEELDVALEKVGKTRRELCKHLGITNVSVWKDPGVPERHIAKIQKFLAKAK